MADIKAFRVYHTDHLDPEGVGTQILFTCPLYSYSVGDGTLSVYKTVKQAGIEVKLPVWRFGPGSGWYLEGITS